MSRNYERELSCEQTIRSRGYANQGLNLAANGKGHGRDAKASNRTWEFGRLAVCPGKAGVSSGRQTHRGKSQKPRSSDSEKRKTESLKPIDKAIYGMVSKPSGRNESERRSSLEKPKPQRPSTLPESEGSMDRRRLTDVAVHSGGVKATARWQGRA